MQIIASNGKLASPWMPSIHLGGVGSALRDQSENCSNYVPPSNCFVDKSSVDRGSNSAKYCNIGETCHWHSSIIRPIDIAERSSYEDCPNTAKKTFESPHDQYCCNVLAQS